MSASLPPVLGLHHFAWRCRNAEETRHFYEDILGLPLVHLIRLDRVPSTGEYCPYVHLFFEMADCSNIAFFDLGDNTAAEPSPNTPPWVNHIALRLATLDQLEKTLKPIGREPHSVIGSSCIGASVIGGICNNSGGSLVRRGPAYTEMAVYAQVDAQRRLSLVNHLGIELGGTPEDVLARLDGQGDRTVEPDRGRCGRRGE